MSKPKPNPNPKIVLNATQIQQIEKLAGLGLNKSQIANVIDISKSTLERRMLDTPEVAEAITKGRDKTSAAVLNAAFKMAVSGNCAAMTIFWLKVREGWRENSDVTPLIALPLEQLRKKLA